MINNRYVGSGTLGREHTRIVEAALGRSLPKGAVIHHVDGNGRNNTRTNLVVCPSQAYHALLHKRTEAYEATGNADSVHCKFCRTWGDGDSNLWGRSNPKRGDKEFFHRACVNAYNAARRAKSGKKWW